MYLFITAADQAKLMQQQMSQPMGGQLPDPAKAFKVCEYHVVITGVHI